MKTTRLAVLALLFASFALVWCSVQTPSHSQSEIKGWEGNEVKSFVASFAPLFKLKESDVKSSKVSSRSERDLDGFSLENKQIKYHEFDWDLLTEQFDGWVEYSAGDEVWQYMVTYLKDDMICYVSEEINADLTELRTLAYAEDNREEHSKQLDEIFKKSSFTMEISCAKFTDKEPSPLEFTFEMSNATPLWKGKISADNLEIRTPEEQIYLQVYSYAKEGEKLIFEGDHFEYGKFRGEIIKASCSHGEEKKSYRYQVELHLGEKVYEWCADHSDPFFISWRQGKLKNLLKKIHYTYTGKLDPKQAKYSNPQMQWNLFETYIIQGQEGLEEGEYLILGKTPQGWETYRSGSYPVDPDTCEKFIHVPGLMDFSIFSSCPRG